jgi:hypothetical protein
MITTKNTHVEVDLTAEAKAETSPLATDLRRT